VVKIKLPQVLVLDLPLVNEWVQEAEELEEAEVQVEEKEKDGHLEDGLME